MNRRSFLGIVTAFTAAAADGVKMPTGAAAVKSLPPPPAALSLQDELMEKLKDCLVVSVSQEYSTDGLCAVRVKYLHRPGGFPTWAADLRDRLDPLIGKMRPINVRVLVESFEAAPYLGPDGLWNRSDLQPTQTKIEVTWA